MTFRSAAIITSAGFLFSLLVACATIEQTSDEGHFGLIVQPVNYEIAKRLGLKQPNGDLVTDVMNGGMADLAGIRPGDVITHFDGKLIRSVSAAKSNMELIDHRQVPIGKSVVVEVLRDGQPMVLKMKVVSAPTDLVERQRQRDWLLQISAEAEKRKADAESAKQQAKTKAEFEALKQTEVRRKECGDDFGKIRVGMTLDRVNTCWGKFGMFRLAGEVNRADGVVSVYEMPMDDRGSLAYAIGVSAIYVIEGKVVGWTR